MKKELLLATALASTMGIAGVAEAASYSISGHNRTGAEGENPDSSDSDTVAAVQMNKFNVSISETTDAGMKIATGFTLTDEGGAESDASGLTLTFTDGSSLQLIEAGSASAAHAVSVPGASGEAGISNTSTNQSPTALTTGAGADAVGFDFATAADAFGIEGFSANASASFNSDASTTAGAASTVTLENSYAVGVTYKTTAGDSSVTIGGGFDASDYNSQTATKDGQVMHVGASVVTGDLTVAAGFMDGQWLGDTRQNEGSFTSVGAKYVSGDITFNVGMTSADAKDEALGVAATGNEDSNDTISASVDYVIAGGVTGTVSYKNATSKDEQVDIKSASGAAWYVGATVSF